MKRLSRLPIVLGGLGSIAVLGAGASLAVGTPQNKTADVRAALNGNQPKNVIYFLGDGMGTQEITALRYYLGVNHKLNVDRMPFTGFDTTWSVKAGSQDWTKDKPDYDPDSAATGTMWATGKKTIDDRISQSPGTTTGAKGTNEGYETVLEQAQEAGKQVGDVTTADVTDATPAVLASHISARGCEGPNNMAACPTETKAAGGLGSIAEQEVDHKIDVLFGGGYNRFASTDANGAAQAIQGGADSGKSVLESAQRQGISLLRNASDLAEYNRNRPVIGLFNQNNANGQNLATEWSGPTATPGAGANADNPQPCNEGARPAAEPSLPAMTTKAISLLEKGGNAKGFFLQVEGASIDKQDHATNECAQLGETKAFDDSIGVALDYQATHPDTLIVVTADHSHTSQITAEDASGSGLPTGYSGNVLTRDGQDLRLSYGTAGFGGAGQPIVAAPPSQQHTGSVVPVWGSGPQAANVLGTNDHTDLFDLLRGAKDAEVLPPGSPTQTVTVTTPGQTTTTPGQTTTTPGETTTTPGQTVTTPGETVTTPAQTVTSPAQTVTAPAQTVTQTVTQTVPVPVPTSSTTNTTTSTVINLNGPVTIDVRITRSKLASSGLAINNASGQPTTYTLRDLRGRVVARKTSAARTYRLKARTSTGVHHLTATRGTATRTFTVVVG